MPRGRPTRAPPKFSCYPHPPPRLLPLIKVRSLRRGKDAIWRSAPCSPPLPPFRPIRHFARASTWRNQLFVRPLREGQVILGFRYRFCFPPLGGDREEMTMDRSVGGPTN
ncbi:hypothetical protein EI94DRAFT_1723218 [Lactarius quietus]|nr:hypothetical protein EI94DRAFT_1723218 [Lactarius quietus]